MISLRFLAAFILIIFSGVSIFIISAGFEVVPLHTIIFMILGALSMVLIFLMWRTRVKNIYQFEIIFMEPGVNPHKFIRGNSLEFEYEYENKKYKIKSDRLYRVKPGFLMRIYFKIIGIAQRFMIVFQSGKKEPIGPIDVQVSSRIVYEVKDSRALGKAMRSEFHVPMDLKKILIIIGFIGVIAAAYLVLTGGIVI